MHSRIICVAVLVVSLVFVSSCRGPENEPVIQNPYEPRYSYVLEKTVAVNATQGVAASGGQYWVSTNNALYAYDSDWNIIAVNKEPFKGTSLELGHIGDIDVCGDELYAAVE